MGNTKEIQRKLAEYLVKNGREFVCENFLHTICEMDLIALSNSNMMYEFEVKISRSDFLVDKQKKKWRHYEFATTDKTADFYTKMCPNYFSYCCPTGLISVSEIPTYSGLYYWDGEGFTIVKKPKRIHNNMVEEKLIKKMLRYHTERKYLGGCRITIMNK